MKPLSPSPTVAMPVLPIAALSNALTDLPAVVSLQRARAISSLLRSTCDAVYKALPPAECHGESGVELRKSTRVVHAHRGLVCSCRGRWPHVLTIDRVDSRI